MDQPGRRGGGDGGRDGFAACAARGVRAGCLLAVSDTLLGERARLDHDGLGGRRRAARGDGGGGAALSASVQLGLLLALATAFVSILGFLYKQRGAAAIETDRLAPPAASRPRAVLQPLVRARHRGRDGSWGLHVAALALAPISLVQSVIAGGLVLLTVMAERLFGIEVTRREWVGVGLCAAGLAVPGGDRRRHRAMTSTPTTRARRWPATTCCWWPCRWR